MPSKERPFIFKQIHDTPSGSEELPELLGEDRAALTIFIKRAWELPGEWHRFPGSDFVLRALPSGDMSRTPRFEIRSAVMSVYTREFRCDLVRRIVDSNQRRTRAPARGPESIERLPVPRQARSIRPRRHRDHRAATRHRPFPARYLPARYLPESERRSPLSS